MTPLFKKLNLAEVRLIHVLNAPGSFEPELQALTGVRIARQVRGKVVFALAFVKAKEDVEVATEKLTRAADGDALLWMVYPKATSKKYQCEFNRDTGWQVLGEAGYEPVRQVAIDEDWSALRFRKAEFIKTMSRNPKVQYRVQGARRRVRRARPDPLFEVRLNSNFGLPMRPVAWKLRPTVVLLSYDSRSSFWHNRSC
jgi:hypothetical protein